VQRDSRFRDVLARRISADRGAGGDARRTRRRGTRIARQLGWNPLGEPRQRPERRSGPARGRTAYRPHRFGQRSGAARWHRRGGEGQYRRRRHADGSWQRLRRRPRCRQPRRRHRDAAARAGSDCRCENSPARTCLRVNKIDQRERASTKPPRSRSDNRRQSVGICCADRTRCGSTSDRNGHRLQCSGPGGTVWGSRAHACLGHAVQRGRSTGFAHL